MTKTRDFLPIFRFNLSKFRSAALGNNIQELICRKHIVESKISHKKLRKTNCIKQIEQSILQLAQFNLLDNRLKANAAKNFAIVTLSQLPSKRKNLFDKV